MKILICSGIYPPDVGGPAKYAKNLREEFSRQNHEVNVLYYTVEKKIPIGLRHVWFFCRVLFNLRKIDLIIALDMFSTGYPAILAGKLFNKKTILRVGGDFLWETYVEKTGHLIKIQDFYENNIKLPFKHRIIKHFQKFTLQNARALAFNSDWGKKLFIKYYSLKKEEKIFVVENYYGVKTENNGYTDKTFLFAGRQIKLKNLPLTKQAFSELKDEGSEAVLEIVDNLSGNELVNKIRSSYALLTVSISDFAPNFIIEGITYGKPFILTKDCGLVERVGDLGILVDSTDKNEIKEAIKSLLNQSVYTNYVQKINNFNFVHSWKDIADEFLNIYKTL